MVKIKRIYDGVSSGDGIRILVDRLWPRGIPKERANLDLWLKDLAPSPELRKWFGHDPDKWSSFREQYMEELRQKSAEILNIKRIIKDNNQVTFLYTAKDLNHNHALVLKEFLEKQ